jgi:hypothetical protein
MVSRSNISMLHSSAFAGEVARALSSSLLLLGLSGDRRAR